MQEAFNEVREKLKQFFETCEDNYFNSDINNLCGLLLNSYPPIPDIKYVIEELHYYSNRFAVAKNDEREKYYQLSLGRLSVLEDKAKLVGVL